MLSENRLLTLYQTLKIMIHTDLATFSSTTDAFMLHFSRQFTMRAFTRRGILRQGVFQRNLWARRSVSNPVPGVSISLRGGVWLRQTNPIMVWAIRCGWVYPHPLKKGRFSNRYYKRPVKSYARISVSWFTLRTILANLHCDLMGSNQCQK